MFDKKEFGNRLMAQRISCKITRKTLADNLYVSKDTYTKWEQGKNIPRIQDIIELASQLNLSVNYLIGIEEEEKLMQEININNVEQLENNISAFMIQNFDIAVETSGENSNETISLVESEAEVFVGYQKVIAAWKQYLIENNLKLRNQHVRFSNEQSDFVCNDEILLFSSRDKNIPVLIRNYGKRIISESALICSFNLMKIAIKYDAFTNETNLKSYFKFVKCIFDKEVSSAIENADKVGKKPLIPIHTGSNQLARYIMYSPDDDLYLQMIGYYPESMENKYLIKTPKLSYGESQYYNNEDYYIHSPSVEYLKLFDCMDYTIKIKLTPICADRKMKKILSVPEIKFKKLLHEKSFSVNTDNAYKCYRWALDIVNSFRECPEKRNIKCPWEDERTVPTKCIGFYKLDAAVTVITEFLNHPLELVGKDEFLAQFSIISTVYADQVIAQN